MEKARKAKKSKNKIWEATTTKLKLKQKLKPKLKKKLDNKPQLRKPKRKEDTKRRN